MVKLFSFNTLRGIVILFLLVLLISYQANAQNEVAIGSATTKSNAILWLNGNGSQGLILPVVTNKTAVSGPEKGMIVYDNADNKVWYRNDNAWVEVGGGGGSSGLKLQIAGNQLNLLDGTTTLSTVNLAAGTSNEGSFMVFKGGQWQFAALTGDVTGLNGSMKVTGLQGKNLATLPATTQALVYNPTLNGGSWTFQTITAGGTVTNVAGTTPLSVANPTTTPTISIDNAGITNALLANDAVNSAKILDASITGADIANTTITAANIANATITSDKLAQSGAVAKDVLIWDGLKWVPGPISAGGTVTSVSAATPISVANGTTTPIISIAKADGLTNGYLSSVDFKTFSGKVDIGGDLGGTATTPLVTRIQGVPVSSTPPGTNQVLQYTGSNWVPATLNVGLGTVTSVTGTPPVTVVNGTTAPVISLANAGITNALIADNAVTSAKILDATIAAADLSAMGATSGQVLQWNGSAWVPTTPVSTTFGNLTTTNPALTITGGTGAVAGSGTTLNIQNATAGQAGLLTAADFSSFSGKVSLAGDLGGTALNPSVTKIQGIAVSSTPPTSNQVLQYIGTSWIPATLTSGTVTSVGLSLPGIFTVTNSPVTNSGVLTGTLATQSQNTVFAAPNGSNGLPTFRSLVSADISGNIGTTQGGTGLSLSAGSIGNGQLLIGNNAGFAKANLTPGAGINIVNGAGTITISSTATNYTASTGLSLTGGAFSVNTSQNIATLSNLTSNGLIKTSGGNGTLSIATSGTDYAPATTGSSILKGNGSGGFVSAVAGTDFLASETDPTVKAISGLVKSNGTTISAAVSGTDYAPATTGSSILKGNGSGGFSSAVAGTDFLASETDPTVKAISGLVKSNGTTISAAVAGTDYLAPSTYTSTGLTMGTAKLLGRTTAASGQAEEISVAGNLTLSGGVLTGTGGNGTVTSLSITSANGISGSVLNPTTTPAISLTLGAITPTSVVATGTLTGSNLSGNNTGDQTITLTGDVTGSGTGSFATTIADGAISGGTGGKITDASITSADLADGAVTASNGLTASNNNVTLGGTLSAATDVNINDQFLSFNSAVNGVTNFNLQGTNSDFFVKGPLPTDYYFAVDGINGRVGINTPNPAAQLDVAGNVKIVDGTEGLGKVLTSDANGLASWQSPSGALPMDALGDIIYGGASGTPTKLAAGTNGQILQTNGAAAPSWVNPGAAVGGTIDVALKNTFFGTSSGSSITTGDQNSGFGHFALDANTIGRNNDAFGYFAMLNNKAASQNVAMGRGSLFTLGNAGYSLTTEYLTSNTAVGYQSLYFTDPTSSSTGKNNTAVGLQSGGANTTGSNNTFIGAQAGLTSTANISNATAIGYNTQVTASNSMVFGVGVTKWGFGKNVAGVNNVFENSVNTAVLTTAGVWTDASDSTFKKNVKNINYGLKEVIKLRPVSYDMKKEGNHDIGFIAQEVKSILPEIVYGEEGQMSISYGHITAVLTKAMQEQQKEIEELKAKLKAKDEKVSDLESSVTAMKDELENIKHVLGLEANAKSANKKIK